MKVLVTGGAGFVGSNLVDALLKQGDEVYCIDNLYTGCMENMELARELGGPRFHFANHDVIEPLDDAALERLFGEVPQFDRIYWLACPASPPHYQRDPVFTLRTSVWGTYNGLELAKRQGARFLISSTSEVYGDPEVHPQPESYRGCVNCTGIRACYDEGKRTAETLCFDYHRSRGVAVRVARIFNTYGPRMDPNDGRITSNFMVQAVKGEPLTIYGDGSQTRSFCFVSDLVAGLMALMESDFIGPCNLGNPDEHTIAEMADIIREVAGSGSSVTRLPLPADDPKLRRPVIDQAREKLKWQPTVLLRDGLKATVEYFRAKLAREQAAAKSSAAAAAACTACDAPSASGLAQ